MPKWAIVKSTSSLFKTGISSLVSHPGVKKSSCQPIPAQRARKRSMRGRSFAANPASKGFTGDTLMRTPRTPRASRRSSSASGAFSSMSTIPRHFAAPILRIASSMQRLSRP